VSLRAVASAAALVALLVRIDSSKLQEPHAWKR
jgi:hypothetical protein